VADYSNKVFVKQIPLLRSLVYFSLRAQVLNTLELLWFSIGLIY